MTTKQIQTKAFQALKKAVRKVIKQHKESGRPIAVWSYTKNKVVYKYV